MCSSELLVIQPKWLVLVLKLFVLKVNALLSWYLTSKTKGGGGDRWAYVTEVRMLNLRLNTGQCRKITKNTFFAQITTSITRNYRSNRNKFWYIITKHYLWATFSNVPQRYDGEILRISFWKIDFSRGLGDFSVVSIQI